MPHKKGTAFERFSSFNALYDASYRVCRNVRWKDSTINFEETRIETILKTEADLRACEYRQLVFSCFSIIERGKPRDIRACHINDRLVQNSLSKEALLPELTPKFVYDNCATLKGKGIDFALERTKYHLQSAQGEYGRDKPLAVLRIDIRKYFDSIDHQSLKNIAKKVIKDKDIYNLCCYIIDTFSFKLTKDKEPIPGKQYYIVKNHAYVLAEVQFFRPDRKYYEYEEKSLGLGSETSQLFALLTLNEIDHYIKEELHCEHNQRYMDDIYIIHYDTQFLAECQKKIEEKLKEIGLEMNQKKTAISLMVPLKEGERVHGTPFKYLKWNFYITTTGHIIMIPFKEKIAHQKRKLRKMQALQLAGEITDAAVAQSYQGWRAHMAKGSTFYIVQDMDNYFRSLFKGVDIT